MRTLTLLLLLTACRTPGDADEDGDGVVASEDCNDADATVFPDAEETCDGIDNDCDGTVDDDAVDASTFYVDGDDDGYGGATETIACDAPSGAVAAGGDCDDADADAYPGAPETDCTDPTDYNCDGSSGFADSDGDGTPACEDCDDADATRAPGAAETCNDLDDDCDGTVDEDATDAGTFFADADEDGFGDAATTQAACEAPSGFVADDTDCDDAQGAVHPGAEEVCNAIDDDCDDTADEDAVDAPTWYADADADGFGDAATTSTVCEQPAGYVEDATDCDDAAAAVKPGATEICNDIDDDCDGDADAGATDASTFYADTDGDGYGDPGAPRQACEQPAGHVTDATDCADGQGAVHPGAAETCADIDEDCDGDPFAGACDVSGGFSCQAGDCASTCGDGVKASDEGCDDDDEDGDDGCSAECEVELGWECTGSAPSKCDTVCGDGIIAGAEGCDDENTVPFDGCSPVCQPGFGDGGPDVTISSPTTINDVRASASGSGDEVALSNLVGAFAEGDAVMLHQTVGSGAGTYEIARVKSAATDKLVFEGALENTYTTGGGAVAQVVQLPEYDDLTVSAALTAPAWNGSHGGILGVLATGTVSVTSSGVIDMSARGFQGPARGTTANIPGFQGQGTLGPVARTIEPNGNGGGGGGRTGCECCWGGGGGGGGHAAAAAAGSVGGNTCQPGGKAGASVGAPEQEDLFFGGAGGGGGADEDGYGSAGGHGGGIVYLAATTIDVGGPVRSNGQDGGKEVNFAGCGSGGGGGGAGGAIVLWAEDVAVQTGLVNAIRGNGGDEAGNCGKPGGAGADGRITVRGADSVTGSTAPGYATAP